MEAGPQDQLGQIKKSKMLLLLLLRSILVAAFVHGLNYDAEQHCYQDLLVSKTCSDLVRIINNKDDTILHSIRLVCLQIFKRIPGHRLQSQV